MVELNGSNTLVFGNELVLIQKTYQNIVKFQNFKILIFDIEKDLSRDIIYENCEFIFMLMYEKSSLNETININYDIQSTLNLTFIDTNNSFFEDIFQTHNFYHLTARQKIIFLNFIVNNILASSYINEYLPKEINIYNDRNKNINITFNILKKKLSDTQINFDIDEIVVNLYSENININNQESFKFINNKG